MNTVRYFVSLRELQRIHSSVSYCGILHASWTIVLPCRSPAGDDVEYRVLSVCYCHNSVVL